jgi:hypothetical protein
MSGMHLSTDTMVLEKTVLVILLSSMIVLLSKKWDKKGLVGLGWAVENDLFHGLGYQLLYEVVPVERRLGLCPLIRLYQNVSGRIPEWATKQQNTAYPVGTRSTDTKEGSKTYVINVLGLKFSR